MCVSDFIYVNIFCSVSKVTRILIYKNKKTCWTFVLLREFRLTKMDSDKKEVDVSKLNRTGMSKMGKTMGTSFSDRNSIHEINPVEKNKRRILKRIIE